MRRISLAAAKAQFSAVLAQVEAGEEVVITRRGVAIARIVAEPGRPADGFDLQELFHSPTRKQCMKGLIPAPLWLSCAAMSAIDGVAGGHDQPPEATGRSHHVRKVPQPAVGAGGD